MKKKKGQVLVLVLLVVVVALAVGLSVASRNLTNLRITTQSEQSQRAFNAAEGGIEDVLSRIDSISSGSTIPVSVGDLQANVVVDKSNEYNVVISEGSVGQVDLNGASGNLKIEWVSTTDPLETASPASIEITRINESGGSYSQQRYAYSGAFHADETGFTSAVSCSSNFVKCVTIPLGTGAKLLRIKPFWYQATVKVVLDGGTLPQVQQYEITSSATSELGLTRKVQVTKTVLPQLPAVFDYVLYSEGDIAK